MLRRLTVLTLALGLLTGACGDDDAGDDNAAVTSLPDDDTTTTTSTTEPRTVAPDVIPTDESLITEDYVEGVLAGLEQARQEAFESTRAAGVVDERAIAITSATRTEPNAARGINSLADLAREGFAGYREDPEPATYTVVDVVTASPSCIIAEIEIDASSYFIEPQPEPPPGRTMVELLPANEDQRSSGLNPTAWVIDTIPVVTAEDEMPDCQVSA